MLSHHLPGRPARLVAVAIAAMLTFLCVVSIAAAVAIFAEQTAISVARAPLTTPSDGTLAFAVDHIIVNDKPAQLMYLLPGSARAPLPPGVAAWPEPGQAVLSPALAAAWDRDDLDVVGTIADSGLASPQERIGYVVPPAGVQRSGFWASADSFGSNDLSARIGVTLYRPPLANVLILFTLTLLTPALVLLVSATRFATRPNMRTAALLEQIGATPRSIRRAQVWVLLPAAAVGVAVAASVAATFVLGDIELPFVGFTVVADQLRTRLLLLTVGAIIGLMLVLTVVWTVCWPQRPVRFTRGPRGRRGRRLLSRRTVTIGSIVLSVFSIGMARQVIRFAPQDFLLWFALAIVATLVAAPLVCRYVATGAASALRWFARRRGAPAATIAGRQIDADAGSWQYASVVSVLLVLVSQVFVAHMVGLQQAKEATDLRALIGDRVSAMQVGSDLPLADALGMLTEQDFAGAPFLLSYIEFDPTTGQPSAHLVGEALSLTEFDVPEEPQVNFAELPAPTAALLRNIAAGDSVTVHVGNPLRPEVATVGVVVGATFVLGVGKESATADEIRANMSAAMAPPWRIELPGDGFVAGAEEILGQGRWIAMLGVIAAAMLSLAVLLRQSAVMDRSVKRTAPLAGLSGRLSLGGAVIAIQIVSMVAIGSLVGGVLSLALGSILTAQGAGAGPPYVQVAAIVMTCSVFAATGIVGYWLSGRRAAAQWNPTAIIKEG